MQEDCMDTILYNGKIYTLDNKGTVAEAICIKGNRIAFVGKNEEALRFKDNNTKLIDLEGRMAVPGFNDSHMHLLSYGYTATKIELNNAKSIEDLILLGKERLHSGNLKEGDWILGRGWNNDYFEVNRLPTRYDLDRITTDFPICYTRVCGHILVVNSKALELVGIDKNSSQIPGGRFDLDENGEPLGIFRENAMNIIYSAIPDPDIEGIKSMILKCSEDAVKHGITSIQTDDFEQLPKKDYDKIIKAYLELIDEGRLKVRVYEQCLLPEVKKLKSFIEEGYNTGWGNEYFKIGPLKLLADGSLGARTAYLTEPYNDDNTTRGIPVFTQEELDELVLTAHNAGMQVAIHGIGDGAMYMAVESIEKALRKNPREDHRHGIVHCQITDMSLMNKFKELNLVAYVQPIFLNYDMHIVEDRVGKEKAKYTYNWKRMLDMGIHVAGGSDCPVEKFDILPNLYSAITRKDLNGYPEDGWLPDQKLSIDEALRIFTVEGAYASFEEDIKGTLEAGKLADIAVLERNLYDVKPEEIKDVKVDLTIMDGKVVYERV